MELEINQPVHLDLPRVPFPMKDIYRRIGMPVLEVKKHSGVSRLLNEALEIAEPLIRPRGTYLFLQNAAESGETVKFKNSLFEIHSRQVAKLLDGCSYSVLFMTTIGESLEERALELSKTSDVTLGFLLDAVASETADAAADYLHRQHIPNLAGGSCKITPRFSAGYGDWPITAQKDILELCQGRKIGISVTKTSLMIPRKSVSAVFGLKKHRKIAIKS